MIINPTVSGTHSGGAPIPLLGGPYANFMEIYEDYPNNPGMVFVILYADIPSNFPGGEGGGFTDVDVSDPDIYRVLSEYMLFSYAYGSFFEGINVQFINPQNTNLIYNMDANDMYGVYISGNSFQGSADINFADGSIEYYNNFPNKISYQIFIIANEVTP